ncbi:tetratricopeptide repeat protein [Rhodoferax koreense]|uniref:tetratricopeptide repeat protein n=1 Tax=Rhodoferax koreensis TaxID=1842727 RepID=UPI00194EADBC|nr:tetratricopeptide repeat protein [Rhodoferax koreense]
MNEMLDASRLNDPDASDPDALLARAIACHQDWDFDGAEALYRSLLRLQPDHPDANHNLGVLFAIQRAEPATALPFFEAALNADSASAQHWFSYIDALIRAGQHGLAAQLLPLAQAHGLQPSMANALADRLGVPDNPAPAAIVTPAPAPAPAAAAVAVAPQALADADKHALVALFRAGDHQRGEALARELIARHPQDGFLWKALGTMLQPQGRKEEALAAKIRAAELLPCDVEALCNLGRSYFELERPAEAVTALRAAIALKPDHAEAHNNLGLALNAQGQVSEAHRCFERAVAHKPDFAEAWNNLSGIYTAQGLIDEAVRALRRAVATKPDYRIAYDNLLFVLNYHPSKSAEDIYEAYAAYERQFGAPLRAAWPVHANPRGEGRRLRVGYVSPDFRHHACTFFMEPLLGGHDKANFEVFAYAELRGDEDAATARYKAYADHWVPTRELGDEALAERIRADGIDILVDLAGHTRGNRLGTFARKPAPVSLSWMGFGCTTGLKAIDYYLTDEASAPAGSEHLFSEAPWRLPDTPYAVYRPGPGMGEVNALPALSRGYITIGTLTRGVRINERTVRVWAQILRRIDGVRLVIDSKSFEDTAVQSALAERFLAHGVAPEQLQIGCHSPPWDVLRGIDIGLDCFPHNSGTTLFETLYMGIPFVTLADRPSVGRIGSAILQGLGRPEWIARSEAEYVDKVVELAQDLPRLALLRQMLRPLMQASPLMDEANFVERVEQAYREMFALWADAHPQPAAGPETPPADMSLAALQAELAYNQANQLHDQGRLDEAEAIYRQALALQPAYAQAHCNLGLVLQDRGRMAEAEAAYRAALAARPDYALALHNLGNVLQHSGELVEAVACYRRALALGLDSAHLFDNLLFLLNYHPDQSAEEIYEAYREYERRFGLPHRAAWAPHGNPRQTARVLRVGYVSPDFCNHAVGRFLEPLLAAHDKAVVEVFAYADLQQEDAATARYKTYVDHWVPTHGLNDDALAERIRADGIDILVDLAGHTKGDRLGVFARKPAPVSLSWMGYGYTTGLTAIDYYLTDEASVPVGAEHVFSEKPWRLPNLPYAVYRPSPDMGEVGTPPVLQRGFVTLGTLSRSIRINAHTLRVWAQIMHRLPDARLVVDSRNFADPATCRDLAARFEALGVGAERLQIGFHTPPWDVLRGIDIGLDCFPHNSGTTLFETLYMGVPVVTLAGRPSVGRIGSAILHGLGRPEWIAATEAEYIDKVVALAQDPTRLALLRMMLRPQMQVSALMDEAAFARGVESAYREMFALWAASTPEKTMAKPVVPTRPGIHWPSASKSAARKTAVAPPAAAAVPSQQEADAVVQLFQQRRYQEGEALARTLIARYPASGFAWKALGVMLQPQGRTEEVLAAKRRAAELMPDDAEAHCNLGHVLQDQGRLAEAEAALHRALKLKPDYMEAHNNLGITYQKQGRLDASLDHFHRALAIDPAQEDIYSNLLFTANYHPDRSAEDIFTLYREYDRRYGLPLRGLWTPHANPRQAGRVLKVGYVSPDFRNHACCRFLEPLLAAHHHGVVETYAYAELAREDEATARYRTYVDHWVPTRGMSDAALAERIRADGIDILVDVAGHTVGNRLGVFARKPAPVSLSWLGFGYTTGLAAIDYYLTDEASAPAGCEALFAEQPWRLPAGWAFRPAEGMGEPGPLPALRKGHLTLGTLTRSVRINHHTIRVWSQILQRLPGAHLVVDSSSFVDPAAQAALAARFAEHGIDAERLHIGYHSPPWDVLRGIDIGLDCFPHNSGTTLFESLYMGVPYVTLAGRASVGRLGSSILQAAGHAEWIAATEADYIEKVVALAHDLPALAAVRQGLRGQMQASILMDEDGFAHQVENAYGQMFDAWRQRNPDALEALVQQAHAFYNQGNAQHDQGLLAEAEASFRQALALLPEFAEAHSNLALVLQQQGRLVEAEPAFRQAMALKPESANAHYNLGTNLKAQGQLKEAEDRFRTALELRPDFMPAMLNLDRVLQDQGRWIDAEVYWRDALRAKPDFLTGYVSLSQVLRRQQRAGEALACLRRALEIAPDSVALNFQVGSVLKDLGRFDEAEQSCRRAIDIDPTSAVGWNNLAEVFNATQRLVEAEQGFRKAIALEPELAPAHGNLGIVLQNQGRLHEAEDSMRRALALNPADATAHGNLLFVLNYHPDKTGDEVFAEYRAYDENFCVQHRAEWRSHANTKDPARVLRVGYVSPDFRSHSCANFLEPLLSRHDKRQVRIYAYAELLREDAATARYKSYVDHWVPTRGMSDAALAERIRADGIDILVDLAGHTGGNRLGVFARKPAPVSLSWMGYGCTTGLSAIDYFLTDEASAPHGSERFFAERPWRLPVGWAYRPAGAAQMGEVSALPALRNGFVTFGTLTRAVRVNHRTVRVWAELLKRVADSRLVIDSRSYQDAETQEELAQRFVAQGIARERLLIGCHSPPWDVLRGIDIGLDCFPHNSGTTLFETLYMGIPYVTLADRPSVGCLGSSILQGIGHPEWIAQTEEDYIARAAALAGDTARLAQIRAGLRPAMQASALMDEAAFTRNVEDAYRQMFNQWCGDNP